MTVLGFDRVSYSYPGAQRPALDDVSLTIAEGEFCVLAGLSASGKSTLLGAACGIVPRLHGGDFAGRVSVGGLDTREHGPGDVAAVAAVLFQDPETQTVMSTVRAELAFPLENRGWSGAAIARGVEEAALALGIEGLLDRSTHELSGGELQRVALGAALVGRPRVVLLDEPTSQLDPVAGDELIWLLRRLNEEWGMAVVLAEHRLERCLAAADRVIALDGGRIGCDADPVGFLSWAADDAPLLQTPAARLAGAIGVKPPPVGVKGTRAALRVRGLLPERAPVQAAAPAPRRPRRHAVPDAALELRGAWFEWPDGRATLRGIDLVLRPGERVALMGRNGAGKSTLLRCIGGLAELSRGSVAASGRVSLLLQNPGDYLLADRVADEVGSDALTAGGLAGLGDRHPHDLSGGERQRLALAVVLDSPSPPAVVLLDEPTRGMDRSARDLLGAQVRELAAAGAAVLVTTHDPELAATCAERVLLMADGRLIADAAPADVLGGGWYFATETARVLGGAGGVLLPDEGAAFLRNVARTSSDRATGARNSDPSSREGASNEKPISRAEVIGADDLRATSPS